MDRIRLLIGSEDSSSRRGLAEFFSKEELFEVVGGKHFDDVFEESVTLQPDILLLDISGETEGFGKKINRLKSRFPGGLILALIEKEYMSGIPGLLVQGVDGCVPRDIPGSCLLKTVELACRAEILCLPGAYKKMAIGTESLVVNGESRNCLPNSGEYLTRREMEVLQLMAGNFSNREIANKLYISEPTVKTHVSSILRKLGQNNRARAIVYSYKTGLINEAPGVL